jgi:predicted metalloprotease with PDZ domain
MRVQLLIVLLVATSVGCATSDRTKSVEPGQVPEETVPTEIDSIAYTLDLSNVSDGHVDVSVLVERSAGSRSHTTFTMSKNWGGVRNPSRFVSDVRAVAGSGADLELEHVGDHQWRVDHAPETAVELRYRLSSPPREALKTTSELKYAPSIEPNRVFVLGTVGLVTPVVGVRDHDAVHVRVHWEGVPDGWTTVTSLGTGQTSSGSAPVGQARRIVMYAGANLRLLERRVQGNTVALASTGDWRFTDRELADALADIVRAERDFFDDHDQAFFLATVLPLDLSGTPYAGSAFYGGTGVYQSFAMFLVPKVEMETETDLGLKHLLAHELFHNWNGQALIRMPDKNEAEVYWFTEGFTEHFTREILLESDLITRKQYLHDLNQQIRDYELNPLRERSNEVLAERFWSSRHAHDLAYQRGALVALMLDHEIREHTDGEKTLADVMRRLFATDQPRDVDANTYLFETFAAFVGEDFLETLRSQVIDGEHVSLEADALGECYRKIDVEEKEPRWGFDVHRSLSSKTIQGVEPDSAASNAGLEDGMAVEHYDRRRGEKGTELAVTIASEGDEETIVVQPDWKMVATPGFEFNGDACRNAETR